MRVRWMGVGVGNCKVERPRRRRGCRAGSMSANAVGGADMVELVTMSSEESKREKELKEGGKDATHSFLFELEPALCDLRLSITRERKRVYKSH